MSDDMEFKIIMFLLGIIITLIVWVANRLFKTMDNVVNIQYSHETRITVLEKK